MPCSKYLPIDQFTNMSIDELVEMYRQGYRIKELKSSCISSVLKGETININAAPIGGTGPYSISFYKKLNTSAPQLIETQKNIPNAKSATIPSTRAIRYTITSDDVNSATGDPNSIPILSPGYIRIIANITDSCTISSGGPKTCYEICDISIGCGPPSCNLIVLNCG